MRNDTSAGSEDSDRAIDLTRRTFVASAGTGVVALATGCKTVQDTTKTHSREPATPRFGYGGIPVTPEVNPDTTPTPPPQVLDRQSSDTTTHPATRTPSPGSTEHPRPQTAQPSRQTDEPSSRSPSGESASGSSGGTGGSIGGGGSDQPVTVTVTPTVNSTSVRTPRRTNAQTRIPHEPSTATPKPTESLSSSPTETSTPTSSGSNGEYEWGEQGYGQFRYGGVQP